MHEFRKIDHEMYKDKTVLVVGSGISSMDYVYHLLMSPWKADVKKCYLTGTSMTFIQRSTYFKELVDQGKLEFIEHNLSEFKPGKLTLPKHVNNVANYYM